MATKRIALLFTLLCCCVISMSILVTPTYAYTSNPLDNWKTQQRADVSLDVPNSNLEVYIDTHKSNTYDLLYVFDASYFSSFYWFITYNQNASGLITSTSIDFTYGMLPRNVVYSNVSGSYSVTFQTHEPITIPLFNGDMPFTVPNRTYDNIIDMLGGEGIGLVSDRANDLFVSKTDYYIHFDELDYNSINRGTFTDGDCIVYIQNVPSWAIQYMLNYCYWSCGMNILFQNINDYFVALQNDSYTVGYSNGYNSGVYDTEQSADTLNRISNAYTQGETQGYNNGLRDGITQGIEQANGRVNINSESYAQGIVVGKEQQYQTDKNTIDTQSASYIQGVSVGYASGDSDGFARGQLSKGNYTFGDFFFGIIDAPINSVLNMFNFEIFGYNVLSLFTGLITAGFILFIVVKLVRRG